MSEQAISYLRENKDRYSKEALISTLKASGYTEEDIVESAVRVYGAAPVANVSHTSPTLDFLMGLFLPLFLFFFSSSLLIPIVDIFLMIYFWKRRRYVSYGVLTRWVIVFLLAVTASDLWNNLDNFLCNSNPACDTF